LQSVQDRVLKLLKFLENEEDQDIVYLVKNISKQNFKQTA